MCYNDFMVEAEANKPNGDQFNQLVFKSSLVFVLYLSILTLTALVDLFSKTLVLALVFLAVFFWLLFTFRYIRQLEAPWRMQRFEFITLVVILVAAFSVGIFHHHLPMGRDDMGYISSAVKIAETGGLEFNDVYSYPFSPFINQGDDNFISQFPPVYSVGLASAYLLFGLSGIYWFNAVLYFFALLILARLALLLTKQKHAALIMVLLLVTSWLWLWFSRRPLSENLMLLLFWLGIYYFISGLKKYHWSPIVSALIPYSLLPLVRIEGLFYLLAYIIVFFIILIFYRKHFHARSSNKLLFIPILILLMNIAGLIIYLWRHGSGYIAAVSNEYFASLGRYVANHKLLITGVVIIIILFFFYRLFLSQLDIWKKIKFRQIIFGSALIIFIAIWIFYHWKLNSQDTLGWGEIRYFFMFNGFLKYGLLLFILIALFGLYKRFWHKEEILIILIASPTLAFLLESGISLDHPWLMRRFFAVLIPLIFLLSTIALVKMNWPLKNLLSILLLLLAFNVYLSLPILTYRDHSGIDIELQQFADHFKKDDLLIMEPGWEWQQWAYTLHYLHGLDIIPRLDNFPDGKVQELIDNHKHIYVIATHPAYRYPMLRKSDSQLIFQYLLHYPELDRAADLNGYVKANEENMSTKIINSALSELPPRQIIDKQILWYITQVK